MPDPSHKGEEALLVARFVEKWVEDRREGRPVDLDAYLSAFPGAEAAVARCFADLESLPDSLPEGPPRTDADGADAAADPEGDAASKIGPYEIVRELGRGGQGVVYLAVDRRIDRRVALKVMEGVGPSFDAAVRRLRREAEVVARLDHPAICSVYDVGFDRGRGYVAMRYVEGETWAARLSRRKADASPPTRAEIRDVLLLVAKIARALDVAHEAGVVHRDVKPANVMIGKDDAPVVLDFGLAHDAAADGATLTRTGDVFGTPAYMAPEQISGSFGGRDRKADVFSLGAALYEALVLRRPFEGPTRDAILAAVVGRDVDDPRKGNRAIGRDVALVVETALAKEPNRRYATAAAFAEDLERVADGAPPRARRAGFVERFARVVRKRPAVASLLAILVVVLAATALVMHGKNTELSRQIEATTRLSDGKRVRDLLLWDERLWPVDPARIGGDEGIDAWLKTAEDVLGRRAAHEASLAALPPVGATSESLDAAADVAWRREILEALVFDLDALPPRVAAMRARREASAALVETTLAKPREIWARIVAEIAADPRYGGLEIEPILGLVPLGRDPKSGLHEFACARTGRPARRASPDVSIAPKPGDGLVFVLIPPGEFTMGATPPGVDGEIGDPNVDPFASRFEVPKRRVRLDAFLVSKFEMTTAQYNDAALREPSTDGFEMHGLHPATGVSWVDAAATLRRVACDFPTEAQWEYAARGGTTTTWWTGDDPKTLAGAANLLDRRGGPAFASQKRAYDEWLDDGAAAVTVVGSYAPNAFGLHDAIGNVAEWARDEFLSYEADPRDGDGFRQGQDRQPRIIRGGSFETPSAHATCAIRSAARPTTTSLALGLRPIFGLFAPKKAAAAPR